MNKTQYLFSYGTLQKEQVQVETFGRILVGKKDTLVGFTIMQIEITDIAVLKTSGQQFHPIIQFTGNQQDKVDGVLFEVTDDELLQADKYEVKDYIRICENFESGKKGYVYVQRSHFR